MSEAEFTKEKLKKLVEKNLYQPAQIHRAMCTKNANDNKEKNIEL